MINNRAVAFFATATFLSMLVGCVTVYEPPAAGDPTTARLRVRQLDGALYTAAYVLPDSCPTNNSFDGDAKRITYFQNSKALIDISAANKPVHESLGMPANPEFGDNFHETRIPAGHEFNFEFRRTLSSSSFYANGTTFTNSQTCKIGLTFTPERGADYEASIARSNRGCRLRLNRLIVTNERVERIAVAAKRIDKSTCTRR